MSTQHSIWKGLPTGWFSTRLIHVTKTLLVTDNYLNTVSLSVFFSFFLGSLLKNTVNSSNSFPGFCYPFPVLSSSRETSRSYMRPLKTITNPHLISSRKCVLRKQELPSMIECHHFSYNYHFYHPFYCCYYHQSIANSLFVLRQNVLRIWVDSKDTLIHRSVPVPKAPIILVHS